MSDPNKRTLDAVNAEIEAVLEDPSTSHWMRNALGTAMGRDVVDAVHDAEILHALLRDRADAILPSDDT